MGIFYDEDETEADEEYEAWFEKNVPITYGNYKEVLKFSDKQKEDHSKLMEQAVSLANACNEKRVSLFKFDVVDPRHTN